MQRRSANLAWYRTDDRGETGAQVAHRLMRGNGLALMAATVPGWGDLGPIVHGMADDGSLLFFANPEFDSPWRSMCCAGVGIMMAIDAYAPNAMARVHMADARGRGLARRAHPQVRPADDHPALSMELAQAWPEALALSVMVDEFTVHCQRGHLEVSMAEAQLAEVDPIAVDQLGALNMVHQWLGERLWRVAAAAASQVSTAPAPIDEQTPVMVLGLDATGVTLLCMTTLGPLQVRAELPAPVSRPAQLVDGLRSLIS